MSEGENFEEADHVLSPIGEEEVGVTHHDSPPARHAAEARVDCAVQTDSLNLPLQRIGDTVTFHRHNVPGSGDCEEVTQCVIQMQNVESASQPTTSRQLEPQNARTPTRRSPLFDNCPDCCLDICEMKKKIVWLILLVGFLSHIYLILYELNSPTVDPHIKMGLRTVLFLTYTINFFYHAVIYQHHNKKLPSNFLYGIACLCVLFTIYITVHK